MVTLRPAVLDDCPVLWRWRNDPETRQASVDEREIPVDTHTRWFEETLKRFDRKLFIVSRDDVGPGDKPRLLKIRAQYDKAPEPKKLVILEGSAHAQFIFQTDQGERLMREILRFLSGP